MTTSKYAVLFIFPLAILACIGLAQAQGVKMVKLPNGEEVVDISGLWDTQFENYGSWSKLGKSSTVIEIKQEGSSFVGIRLKETRFHRAGSEALRGEVDKNAIRKVQYIAMMVPMDADGQISDDGKTITFDVPDCVRLTMTRK